MLPLNILYFVHQK